MWAIYLEKHSSHFSHYCIIRHLQKQIKSQFKNCEIRSYNIVISEIEQYARPDLSFTRFKKKKQRWR